MGRLRATIAPSDLDRAIAERVGRAERELEEAARLAHGGRKQNYRARRVERDLARALDALRHVGTVSPRFGDDPDLVSEEERTLLARGKQEQARQAAREAAVAERGEG